MKLPIWPLRTLLHTVPDRVHTEMMCRAANHFLRGQSLVERLDWLEGKRVCLSIADVGNALCFLIEAGKLHSDRSGHPWDVRIEGNLADFLLLATRAEDPDTLFFARRLSIEGDTEVGLYVKNLLDGLDFDFESHLAEIVGENRAHQMLSVANRLPFRRPLESAARRVQAMLVESVTAASLADAQHR